jgi:hypothetical protein
LLIGVGVFVSHPSQTPSGNAEVSLAEIVTVNMMRSDRYLSMIREGQLMPPLLLAKRDDLQQNTLISKGASLTRWVIS